MGGRGASSNPAVIDTHPFESAGIMSFCSKRKVNSLEVIAKATIRFISKPFLI